MKRIVIGLIISLAVFHIFLLCGGLIFYPKEFANSEWHEYVFTLALFTRDTIRGSWVEKICNGSLILTTIIAGIRAAQKNENIGGIILCSFKYLLGLFAIYLIITLILAIILALGVPTALVFCILTGLFAPATKAVIILLA